jgi:hydroxypyruvate isomerase
MSSTQAAHSPADYVVNCSTLLTELPVLERPAAAKEAGFEAIEFWWPFADAVPADGEVDGFVAAVQDAGVRLVGLNFFAGDMPGGDRGIVSWPGREAEFRENVAVAAAIGERLDCHAFNALYGLRLEGHDVAEQDAVARHNLAVAAEGVAAIDGTVLLEPVSGAEAYPLRTAADALAVVTALHETGTANIALLADLFHLAVNGEDVAAVIEEHAADFGHLQIADAPGRGAPGTGDLPLHTWIGRARELGYRGEVALEYKQDRATAFDWLQPAAAAAR